MEQTTYEQPYYEEAPRPTPPLLWVGLTAFFALCCCFFFVIAGVEAVFLFGGTGTTAPTGAVSGKPEFGEIEFYLAQKSSTEPSGEAVTAAPAGTKALYGFFTYKNMPKTGAKWSYEWMLDGEPLGAESKSDIAWTREGNGRFSVRLTSTQPLKAGDYDLFIKLNGKEVAVAAIGVAAK